jgi:hypothetical protein
MFFMLKIHQDFLFLSGVVSFFVLRRHKLPEKINISEFLEEIFTQKYEDPLVLAARQVAENNTVFFTIIDTGYVELGINLFESIEKLKIRNFLFMARNAEACEKLKKHGAKCYLNDEDSLGNKPSHFYTDHFEFILKNWFKTEVSLKLLKAGLNAVAIDSM